MRAKIGIIIKYEVYNANGSITPPGIFVYLESGDKIFVPPHETEKISKL
jgi:hypothetical protein